MDKEYQRLMGMHDECVTKAIMYGKCKEPDLARFWYNAGKEFKRRALELNMEVRK